MKLTLFTTLALVASVFAVPQAVTETIKPKGKAPSSCKANYDGEFEVSIFRLGKSDKDKRNLLEKRGCSGDSVLSVKLKNGVLKDAHDRTGYIASNYQFQFDGPPQAGALYTAGFSACSNGSLALGSSTVFYQCLSGDFYNLYDRSWAEQCEPIEIIIMPCGGAAATTTDLTKNKKVVGSSIVATTVVTVLSDGQPQVRSTTIAVPMCQIGDGQVQVHTTPCEAVKIPVITAAPITQSSDGKIQVPSSAPDVSEIVNTVLATPVPAETSTSAEETLQVDTEASPVPSTTKKTKAKSTHKAATTMETAEASTTSEEEATATETEAAATSAPASSSLRLIPSIAAAVGLGLFGVFLQL